MAHVHRTQTSTTGHCLRASGNNHNDTIGFNSTQIWRLRPVSLYDGRGWGGVKARVSVKAEHLLFHTSGHGDVSHNARYCVVDLFTDQRFSLSAGGERAPPQSNEAGDDLKSIAVPARCNVSGPNRGLIVI